MLSKSSAMPGSVAEALLASGSKKLPMLPPPPKLKKDPKTFTFDLELSESNEQTYPEFSWIELVRNAEEKEITKKIHCGVPTLNPYVSDDEEDLKAMAAKFEAKYNTAGPLKKKKRRMEDYIDKGAGYDESDAFIDNSEVYDEVVPVDLQTAHGGFYINTGLLEFKQVELSEDEDDRLSQQPSKVPTLVQVKNAKAKIATGLGPKLKNPVPPGVGNKMPSLPLDKNGIPTKRKLIVTPIGPNGKFVKPRKIHEHQKPELAVLKSENSKSSSASQPSSSSCGESLSSSDEETKNQVKVSGPVKTKLSNPSTAILAKEVNSIIRQSDATLLSSAETGQIYTQAPAKRLNTKKVHLNHKLHLNLATVTSTTPVISIGSLNPTPYQQISTKVHNKDLIKTNGGSSINMKIRTPSATMPIPTLSPSLKIVPPKRAPTPTVSPGVTASAVVASRTPKASINKMPSSKTKVKDKQAANSCSNMPTPSQSDIFNTLTGYNTLNLKGGLNLIGAKHQETRHNSKKNTQLSPGAEKLVQKQKAATTKPVKSKPKNTNSAGTPPSSHASGNTGSTYLATYKTPPTPEAGPGVEISKVRTTRKTTSNTATQSSLGLATFSRVTRLTPAALRSQVFYGK